MNRISAVTREPVASHPILAASALPRSDWGRYKDCVNAQSTLSGKKGCLNEYLDDLAEDKNP
ncbi:MAG: hypothetical protein AMXMBFR82_42690 [Candidatus Hydrogenedentota bacterium]